MNKKALYKIIGLPPNYTKNTLNVSEDMLKKLKNMLSRLPITKIFISGDVGGFTNLMIDTLGINVCRGIDYKKVFADTFDKEKSAYKVPYNKVVMLYGVGDEQAVSSAFSSQLLKGLLKTLEEHSCTVFIQTDLSYPQFLDKYNIVCKNILRLPKKQEDLVC